MSLFQRRERALSKTEKRARRLPDDQLLAYVDTALYAVGRSVSDWRKSGDLAALIEAQEGAEALHAVVSELLRRRQALQ